MPENHFIWLVWVKYLRCNTCRTYRLYFSLAFGTKTNPFLNQKQGFLVLINTCRLGCLIKDFGLLQTVYFFK